jgi:hypothetical protein
MNDPLSSEQDQARKQKVLVMELITEASRDLKLMRDGDGGFAAFDPVAWRKIQNTAHNIAARAAELRLGVLQLCARELEQFAAEILRPTDSDKSESVQGAVIALEMLDLELLALKRSSAPS